MDDTISRADAIEQIQAWAVNLINPKMLSREDAVYILESMPSAQPEIIRCRDCKYQDENQRRVSVRWLPCMEVQTDSNWYCGSAERGRQ